MSTATCGPWVGEFARTVEVAEFALTRMSLRWATGGTAMDLVLALLLPIGRSEVAGVAQSAADIESILRGKVRIVLDDQRCSTPHGETGRIAFAVDDRDLEITVDVTTALQADWMPTDNITFEAVNGPRMDVVAVRVVCRPTLLEAVAGRVLQTFTCEVEE